MTTRTPKNIPIPDPSDKTGDEIRSAIANVRSLIDEKLGGAQAVIAERLNSIEKRLSDGFVETRASVAVALAGVVEAGKDQTIKFETLERRVAALELSLSQSGGRSQGFSAVSSSVYQIIAAIAALVAVVSAMLIWGGVNR